MDRSDYLPADKLQELLAQIDPTLQLDHSAEEMLQDVADDFVENVTAFACELVRHREGAVLEEKDIKLALEKRWDMRLAGVGDLVKKPPQAPVRVHLERMQAVRRSQNRS
uniref:Transcription initiation factor TFIID subunit 12 domain-containing protein n=1 Tax=Calcidiscus leptoporus TaxID=127549 RepID=A0A7S0IKH7_9EUKA|mmetsp:Transcript_11979/g.27761  ORF Transcript_11979/g.27761 Transcript_11979/m.27761 type:complete len:110 (+) Transcript_11979:40-369(+)